MSTLAAPSKNAVSVEGGAETPILALATRISSRPATVEITQARSTLADAIAKNENDLHDIATGSTSAFAQQLQQNKSLGQSSEVAQREVRVLVEDFDVTSLDNFHKLESFRETASSRQSLCEAQVVADMTARAVDDLKRRYHLLCRVEDGVWSGKSADPSTVEALIELDRSGKQDASGAAVQMALSARSSVVRTIILEQLSNAWMQTISIANNGDGLPSIIVRRSVSLSPPKVNRSTPTTDPPSPPPSFTFENICDSLESLKALTGLIHDLHTRIVRNVIEPILEHSTWRPVEQSIESALQLETTIVSPQDRLGVIRNVKSVLEFVNRALPRRCRLMESRLQESAFNLILSRILIPSLPSSVEGLPEWLRLACQAEEWEAMLRDSDNTTGVVRLFLNIQAGQVWLQKRRAGFLRQARRAAYEGWSSWASKDVQLDSLEPSHSKTLGHMATAEEDGWGFDDAEPAPNRHDSHDSAALTMDVDDGHDGWDFDDVAPAPKLPTPSMAKPREAKRLGKKTARQETASPSPPLASPAPEPLPQVNHRPVPLDSPSLSSTFKVSLATDTVLKLAGSTLAELAQTSSLNPKEYSFAGASRGLAEQLAEALDLIRVTVPVAQLKSIEAAPFKLVQLSNDYKYLSINLGTLQADIDWVDRINIAQRFSTASAMTLERFVTEQSSVVADILHQTNSFSDSSNTNAYMQADHAVQQLVSHIKETAAQLADYVNADVYYSLLGKLVESAASSVLDSVLALEDITELESQRIGSMLNHIETLGQLFQPDPAHVSTAAAFVPHWIKFGYLNELLRAKLVEITHLFENGSLVDFTPNELGGLIRALFADSPQRATLLDKIEM